MALGSINYAQQYSDALAQEFPHVLSFGKLYATPNNGRYRVVDGKTIQVPTINVNGRTNANRDVIGAASRNYDNAWEPKVLTNQRKWSTLVHPMDINQTNMVASIQNITTVFNEEQKFPEMDSYLASKVYADWVALGQTASTTALTEDNILQEFDKLMLAMSNKRTPPTGRILYCTHEVDSTLKRAKEISRTISVQTGGTDLMRMVTSLDQVEIVAVPSELMKTAYDFTEGWKPAEGAKQINMFLVHPLAVITPVSYQFAKLDAPGALTEGKWVYYEESFEDVFILNKKVGAIQFNVSAT